MLRIAIDGACRRNGKPDCVSAGGVFIQHFNEDASSYTCSSLADYEINSTNQRGELLALLTALNYISSVNVPAQIITDSEYLFNTMTKEWYVGWQSRDWLTAGGDPVKNSDLWKEICEAYSKCSDVTFYHIKGHCIPFGKVRANTLLNRDGTGTTLYEEVLEKYDYVCSTTKKDKLAEANKLSEKNNGFALEESLLKQFVSVNVMADAIATRCVDGADLLFSMGGN